MSTMSFKLHILFVSDRKSKLYFFDLIVFVGFYVFYSLNFLPVLFPFDKIYLFY